MMTTEIISKYAHITSDPHILSGVPIIAGTRTPVRAIAQSYVQLGMSMPDIKSAMQHLSESQIFSALAFYFDNREEIDEDSRRNEDFEYLKSITAQHPGTSRIQER